MYPDDSAKSADNNVHSDTNSMKYVGDVVNAALTFAARQEHAP